MFCKLIRNGAYGYELLTEGQGAFFVIKVLQTSSNKIAVCAFVVYIVPPDFPFITEKKLRTHISSQLFWLFKRAIINFLNSTGSTTSTIGPKLSMRITISVSSDLLYLI